MRKSVALLGLSVTIALIGVACTDSYRSPTAPAAAVQASAPVASDLLGILVPPVHRTTPLASDVSWTFTAGPGGGYTSNPSLGITVIVPPGALATTETITVTALAGAPVAYGFEPHLVFAKKVTIKQNLAGTDVTLLGSLLLHGGHFAGDVLELDPSGLALVDEIIPASIISILFQRSAVFNVGHFSGYILMGSPDDDSGGSDGGGT